MRTVLYEQHLALGAKIVEFAGWDMPIHYTGVVSEHHSVRERAGLFDVSHMGRIVVEGDDAEPFLDYLSTNAIMGKLAGSATYTAWCHGTGGTVDDVILYKEDDTHFFVIVNAGNRSKDLAHMKKYAESYSVRVTDRFSEEGILALQGPQAQAIMALFFPEALSLPPMHFLSSSYHGEKLIISTTGYTGAGGFELYVPLSVIVQLWTELLDKGQPFGLVPVGLGARDTLRLEMGFALYGHELTDAIDPIESVSAWTVKEKAHNFLGKEHQEKQKRTQHGLVLLDPGVAREGYEVFKDGTSIGLITSGTFSPTLQKAIAIVISSIPLALEDLVEVQIRHHRCKAKVVKIPFLASLR